MKYFVLLVASGLLLSGCSSVLDQRGPIDSDAPTEFTVLDSGLQYRILRQSDGNKPSNFSKVKVHYHGTLDDGTVFDSSYSRGKPAIFGLNQVVAGWTEGLQLIGEGGMIELRIPPELGYGSAGSPPVIPGDATLTFSVEMIRVF